MKILVINSGSSSLKYTLFLMGAERCAGPDRARPGAGDRSVPRPPFSHHGNGGEAPFPGRTETGEAGCVDVADPASFKARDHASEQVLFEGSIDRVGLAGSRHVFRACAGDEVVSSVDVKDHGAALDLVLATLSAAGPNGLGDPAAVAHRIGHGGNYHDAVRIDEGVKAEIRRMTPMIPLHHPAMLKAIEECELRMPRAVHVAVFDTSFHRHIPDKAAVYGLPFRYFAERGYRRTGFHGHSHEFVSGLAARHLGRPIEELRIISCHLGNGASLCAIDRGRSVDTTLGMTAVEGLIMGTRSGDVDPGLIPVIMKEDGLTPDGLLQMLYHESGLKAISGISPDMREVEQAAAAGNTRAVLALEAFCYRVKRAVGSMLMVLGGCDVLIFTGGIGCNSSTVRQKVLEGAEGLGFVLNSEANLSARATEASPVVQISAAASPTRVLAIRTFEELIMARQCLRVVEGKGFGP
ncbi:MAG: acetate/propionate family kinase [Thermodesulfobacteriota bacterium]